MLWEGPLSILVEVNRRHLQYPAPRTFALLKRCCHKTSRMMPVMTTPDSPLQPPADTPPDDDNSGSERSVLGTKRAPNGTKLPPNPDSSPPREIANTSSGALLIAVLSLLCLMIRLLGFNKSGLGGGGGTLPIFGDEAIYLRWAQLIGDGHWWISLIDPKPPLHFWLIALFFNCARDPLIVSRFLSIACGVLSIPALAAACNEIASFFRPPAPSGRILGLIACVLAIFCPFLNFYQRLGTADALFILQMLLATWLSLRWARFLAAKKTAWLTAITLGIAMASAMMTRQGLSYVLWALPPVALLLALPRPRLIPKAILQFTIAGLIALVIWTPYLTADLHRFAAERGGTKNEIKTRILYQNQFTDSTKSRLDILRWNATCVFIPTCNADGQPETGWLYLYLTWPVYFASGAGFLWLAFRRQWKVLSILLLWCALMLGVPMALGAVLRSRYIVAAVPPLLIAASFFLLELLGLGLSARRQWIGWSIALLLFAAVILLPLREIAKQGTTWWNQTLTREDRYQHITGWTAGTATMDAINFIKNFAPRSPIVVITNDGWGTPADAEWVYLSAIPNITLYYTNHKDNYPLLTPSRFGEPDVYMLRKDKWLYTPEVPVHIPPETIILYMNNDPVYTKNGPLDPEAYFKRLNPNLIRAETFYNYGTKADKVVLFELKRETRKNND